MEIAGLVVGIAGLAAVFETGCEIWLTVAKASQYGESVANALSKLKMEFFKFHAWFVVLERLSADPRARSSRLEADSSSFTSSNLKIVRQLQEQCQSPIYNAASNITRLLQQLQAILEKNGALDAQKAATATPEGKPTTSDAPADDLQTIAASTTGRYKAVAARLQKSTPFRKRVMHAAKPWAGADRAKIAEILDEITYWNRSLYELLPSNIRESVMVHGTAGYLLESTDENLAHVSATQDADAQSRVAVECARLVELRKRLRKSGGSGMPTNLRKSLDEMDKTKELADHLLDIVATPEPFSILRSVDGDECRCSPPMTIDTIKLILLQ